MNQVIERIGAALSLLESVNGNIEHLSIEDLQYIPMYILKKKIRPTSLEKIWPFLPMYKRFQLRLYLPCRKHTSTSADENDGSPPLKKHCTYCIHEEKENE